MHLPVKVIRQPAVIIQPGQVRATDVADLQLLMARGPRGVRKGLELALFVALGLHGLFDAEEFFVRARHFGGFAKDFDFEESGFDGFREVGDLFQLEEDAR